MSYDVAIGTPQPAGASGSCLLHPLMTSSASDDMTLNPVEWLAAYASNVDVVHGPAADTTGRSSCGELEDFPLARFGLGASRAANG